jgi:lipoprotein signal peptidase
VADAGRVARPSAALPRALVTVGVAAALAAVDLAHKALAETPEWAYHGRTAEWYALTAAVVVGCVSLARIPSLAVAAAAGVLAGGAAGNALSGVASRRGVPNPIVVVGDRHVVAFNLADVFTVGGIALLVVVLATVSIRNRHRLLPPRRLWRALRARVRR